MSPIPESRFGFLRRRLSIILVLLVILYESIMKGWMAGVAIPSLFILVPAFLIVQSRARKLLERGEDIGSISLAARSQMIGLLTAYVCLPGFGDTSDVAVLGLFLVDYRSPLVGTMWFFSISGLVVVIVSTVAFFLLPRRGKGS